MIPVAKSDWAEAWTVISRVSWTEECSPNSREELCAEAARDRGFSKPRMIELELLVGGNVAGHYVLTF